MALPYFLSAQPYVYEHLISRALTSFFFFFLPSSPVAPLRCPPAQLVSVSAGGRPRPGMLGMLSRPRADGNLPALWGEMLTLAGSRDGAGRKEKGMAGGRCRGTEVIHQPNLRNDLINSLPERHDTAGRTSLGALILSLGFFRGPSPNKQLPGGKPSTAG